MYYLRTLEVTGCHPPKTELEWRRRHLLLLLCARRGWNPSASSNQKVQMFNQPENSKGEEAFPLHSCCSKRIFKQMSAGGTSVVLKSIISIKLGDKCLWRAIRLQDNLWQKVVRRFNYEDLTRSFYIYIRNREHFPVCHFSGSAVENLPGPRLALKSRAFLTYILWQHIESSKIFHALVYWISFRVSINALGSVLYCCISRRQFLVNNYYFLKQSIRSSCVVWYVFRNIFENQSLVWPATRVV